MFRIIRSKGFGKRFLLNFLMYLPLFIIIQLFTSENKLFSVRTLMYLVFMSGLLSMATSFRQFKEEFENSAAEDYPSPKKGFPYFLRFFAFACILILVLVGVLLMIALPVFYFLDEPVTFEDWEKWLLLIAVIAAYACLSDWFFSKMKRERKVD